MKVSISRCLLLSLGLALPPMATAGNSDTLTVRGDLKPGACQVQFDRGVLDFGTLPAARLNATTPTELEPRRMGYGVICPGAMKVASQWMEQATHARDPGQAYYRLGTDDAEVGGYRLTHHLALARGDGQPAAVLISQGEGQPWAPVTPADTAILPDGSQWFAFAASGAISPGAFIAHDGEVVVEAYLNPAETLNLEQELDFYGQVALSLNYF